MITNEFLELIKQEQIEDGKYPNVQIIRHIQDPSDIRDNGLRIPFKNKNTVKKTKKKKKKK